MSDDARFAIRLSGANRAMAALGMTPSNSFVEVGPTLVTVQLGWAFRAYVERNTVRSVDDDHDPVRGWGAHGWNGVWLVNGSSSGIVRVELDPPGSARVVGVPVTLRVLRVAVEDPAGLIATLTPG